MSALKIGARYKFTFPHEFSARFPDHARHSGQQVTLLEPVTGPGNFYTILADDDWIDQVRGEELRKVNKVRPYITIRDAAMERLKRAGVKDIHFHDFDIPGMIPRTSFSGNLPPEPVAVGCPYGWRWAPRVRYVHVMGPNIRPGTDIPPFWYVTSNLEGSITRGDKREDYSAKHIFAHGATSLEAVQRWVANYCGRKYNER